MFTHLPRECKEHKCDHEPGRCVRFRSRQCLSGECSHAKQNLHCGQNYLPPAPAPHVPGTVDTSRPFGYRVVRTDTEPVDHDEADVERTLVTGYCDVIGRPRRNAAAVAKDEVHITRIGHNYYGPLTVYVWQVRADEHYRLPVPADAEQFDFAAAPELEPKA